MIPLPLICTLTNASVHMILISSYYMNNKKDKKHPRMLLNIKYVYNHPQNASNNTCPTLFSARFFSIIKHEYIKDKHV